MLKKQNPDEKAAREISEEAVGLGMRLATLISLLKISDDGKDALLYLLEECTMEELEKISDVLEAFYAESQTKQVDEKFAKEAEKLRIKWEKKEGRLAERAVAKIQKLEEELDKKIESQAA
ncbi:MAG: hypothetical protein Q8R12_01245 [bacterium]|nr:hypothetical protein [bacterium]